MLTKKKNIRRGVKRPSTITRKSFTYEKDFYKWTQHQANVLRERDFSALDIDHLIEEIESLGASDRRALKNHLVNLLKHLLKKEFQPSKRTRSWEQSVANAKRQIAFILEDSPSLKNELKNMVESAYGYACKQAAIESGLNESSFPKQCPWNIKEICG